MTTEYYQIPSQQGFLAITEESADPWLAAATSSLSIADWSVNKENKHINTPPSLFDSEDAEATVAWKNIVPLQYNNINKPDTIKVPKQFISTSSKIDAWSVIPNTNNTKQVKKNKANNKQAKQPAPVIVVQQEEEEEESPKIEEELSIQNRYKTELCKSFNETGACRYGSKCQFAHGKQEVRSILRHPKYKTETCKTFHTTGTCPYGTRCRFIHTRSKEQPSIIIIKQEEEEDIDDDEVNVSDSQWSKSWAMSASKTVF